MKELHSNNGMRKRRKEEESVAKRMMKIENVKRKY